MNTARKVLLACGMLSSLLYVERGAPTGLSDILHIVWTAAWLKRFAYCTVATVVVMLLFGALTGLQGLRVAANLPTPAIGIYERIDIGAFLLWVVVLAADLWPRRAGSKRLQHA
jgi:hypothetical protein